MPNKKAVKKTALKKQTNENKFLFQAIHINGKAAL
jgi:hypothetical protein